MPTQDFILAPTTVQVRLDLAPARNTLNSIHLLNAHEVRSGLGEWITRTVAALSPEERRHNLIIGVLYSALIPKQDFATFPDYLDSLATQPAESFRDLYLNHLVSESPDSPTQDTLLNDRAVYVEYVARLYQERIEVFNTDLYMLIHELLQSPDQLKALILTHLHKMWDEHLAAEWQRILPMLNESIQAFQQLDFTDLTVLEAARAVTGRDLSGFWEDSEKIKTVVFIPSAHIGPYISRLGTPPTVYVVFAARVPEGVKSAHTDLPRSDLLIQLNALADDTRLSILELLTHHQELSAQDIINQLHLSQSSASRHLRQLTATGYLTERRREIAKYYSLNYGRIEESMLGLRLFLSKKW